MPEGTYTIEGVSFEEAVYSTGNEGIEIRFKIVGPSHAGRNVWEKFVITSKSTVGKSRLKAFVAAVGINVDTTPLNKSTLGAAMNQPLQANIGIEPGSNGYPDKNKIKSFLSPGAEPAQQQSAPAAAPAQQAAQPTGQQLTGTKGLGSERGEAASLHLLWTLGASPHHSR